MRQFFVKRADKIQPATIQQLENLRNKLKPTDLVAESSNGPWMTWEKAESKLFPMGDVGFADLEIPTFQQTAIPPSTYWQPPQPQQPVKQVASKEPSTSNKGLLIGLAVGGGVLGLLLIGSIVATIYLMGSQSDLGSRSDSKQTFDPQKFFEVKMASVLDQCKNSGMALETSSFDVTKTDSIVSPYSATLIVTAYKENEPCLRTIRANYACQDQTWVLKELVYKDENFVAAKARGSLAEKDGRSREKAEQESLAEDQSWKDMFTTKFKNRTEFFR